MSVCVGISDEIATIATDEAAIALPFQLSLATLSCAMTSKKPAKNVLHDLAYFLAFVVVVVALIPLVALTRKTIWATISPERPTI